MSYSNALKRFVILAGLGAMLSVVSGCGSPAVDTPEAKEHAVNQASNRINNQKAGNTGTAKNRPATGRPGG